MTPPDSKPQPGVNHYPRLESLDILRGFDMFLLVFFQPVFLAVARCLGVPWLDAVAYQLDHESWAGFRFWDLVMPLFLFMTGASMPFAFGRKIAEGRVRSLWPGILRRVALLFILGMVVQGNLLSLDTRQLRLYSNTLQAIAAGYLIASVIILNLKTRWQIVATAALLLIYWIPMTFMGDFTPEGNFAEAVDRAVLGRFRDGVYFDEIGSWHFSSWYTYTWIWSSLTFGVTVMLGAFCGSIIRNGRATPRPTAIRLLVIGVVLVAAGLLWNLQMPIIKRLWTASMTLYAGGWCFILMAVFYWVIDGMGFSSRVSWLKIYGMNSITAYVLGEVVNFRSIPESLSYGLKPILGPECYSAWITFANYLIVFLILLVMYRRRIFIKL